MEGTTDSVKRNDFPPQNYGIVIKNGEVLRLWSYNSASGGRFVSITEAKATSSTQDSTNYVVAATQEQQPSSEIKFIKTHEFAEIFKMQFQKNDGFKYTLNASQDGSITAAEIADSDSVAQFTYYELDPPNQPYVVLPSTNRSTTAADGKIYDLYLSSDGAGNMSLKRWNLSSNALPPKATALIDPSLLFRVVKP
ncbi:uncharacterized protein LOC114531933 [Dendronephthya gigantea]|uniref:uncharacterized protein LOC114531933 n=1 Tax=Dendronephthya gigantea TaxID=151771 RepID=UPI00106CF3C1|nr:uncharacterized protein LOC114531933 [Dendronephthya gigantea]